MEFPVRLCHHSDRLLFLICWVFSRHSLCYFINQVIFGSIIRKFISYCPDNVFDSVVEYGQNTVSINLNFSVYTCPSLVIEYLSNCRIVFNEVLRRLSIVKKNQHVCHTLSQLALRVWLLYLLRLRILLLVLLVLCRIWLLLAICLMLLLLRVLLLLCFLSSIGRTLLGILTILIVVIAWVSLVGGLIYVLPRSILFVWIIFNAILAIIFAKILIFFPFSVFFFVSLFINLLFAIFLFALLIISFLAALVLVLHLFFLLS